MSRCCINRYVSTTPIVSGNDVTFPIKLKLCDSTKVHMFMLKIGEDPCSSVSASGTPKIKFSCGAVVSIVAPGHTPDVSPRDFKKPFNYLITMTQTDGIWAANWLA